MSSPDVIDIARLVILFDSMLQQVKEMQQENDERKTNIEETGRLLTQMETILLRMQDDVESL